MQSFNWWRVTNIVNRTEKFVGARSVAELSFDDNAVVLSTFTNSVSNYNTAQSADKAFDKNINTYAHSTFTGDVGNGNKYNGDDETIKGLNWFIGCKYDREILPKTVKIKMRPDMVDFFGQEWQTATIQCSSNGVDWVEYGYIAPRIAQLDVSEKTVTIHTLLFAQNLYSLSTKKTIDGKVKSTPHTSFNSKTYLQPLTASSSPHLALDNCVEGLGNLGYIAGRVYEKINSVKVPIVRPVYCFHQASGKLIGKVWSNTKGEYLFTNLTLDSEYMIISIDTNKQFGVEGVAYKKAKEVVVNGLQLSYPITD